MVARQVFAAWSGGPAVMPVTGRRAVMCGVFGVGAGTPRASVAATRVNTGSGCRRAARLVADASARLPLRGRCDARVEVSRIAESDQKPPTWPRRVAALAGRRGSGRVTAIARHGGARPTR
ncbi:MAG: hypothetical protein MUE62_07970 [Burkholderiaceae bacterium]|nr:hypothetical protein [Burkholderiaceae bacterium]